MQLSRISNRFKFQTDIDNDETITDRAEIQSFLKKVFLFYYLLYLYIHFLIASPLIQWAKVSSSWHLHLIKIVSLH